MVQRRIGREDSETRDLLLEAAEMLMREEGYAAVTSRKLARRADLKPQLVHYYFRTMDELFEALFEKVSNRHLDQVQALLGHDNPLPRLFEIGCDTPNSVLHIEFLALANHRKELQTQIAAYGTKLNRLESEIISSVLAKEGIVDNAISPQILSTIIETAARGLSFAERLNAGRFNDARTVLYRSLDRFGATYKVLAALSRD